jgi:hypothetical protein
MSYIILRGRWCNIIVLNVHAPTEDKTDDIKDRFYEVNTEKTKYMSLSRHKNAGQNNDIKIGHRWFENVAQLKYLGTTITNRNLIQEEIKRRLNSDNGCYHSVQNLLSSRQLSKNIKVSDGNRTRDLWICSQELHPK